MNRERMRKTVLAVVGLFYVGLLYPLCSDLWHSHWLLEMQGNDCEPMFLSFFIGLGFFLLLIVRRPSPHRFFIGFAAQSAFRNRNLQSSYHIDIREGLLGSAEIPYAEKKEECAN